MTLSTVSSYDAELVLMFSATLCSSGPCIVRVFSTVIIFQGLPHSLGLPVGLNLADVVYMKSSGYSINNLAPYIHQHMDLLLVRSVAFLVLMHGSVLFYLSYIQ